MEVLVLEYDHDLIDVVADFLDEQAENIVNGCSLRANDDREEKSFVLAVFDGQKPISSAEVRKDDDNKLSIINLATCPRYRRQGCGFALLSKALDVAKSKGCSHVKVSSHDSVEALSLYESFGFKKDADYHIKPIT